jgi:molybdopterin synthase catalytic subunit
MKGRPRRVSTITADEISPEDVLRSVADPGAGATVLFLGTVRDIGNSGEVREMTYEAYVPLARKSLLEIEREIRARWKTKKVKIVHRIGRLGLEETSVAVAVSSAHRQEAFEACKFGIDKIKRAVPIWKKETLSSGAEVWTEGRVIMGARAIEGV